jgi:enterochelin esterase-like enzyme
MVFIPITRTVIALFIIIVIVSCVTMPVPNQSVAPLATLIPPTPTHLCDRVNHLAPERPTIPRPALIPIPTLTPRIPVAAARSDLIDAKFYSQLIGKEMPVLIYLPPGYYNTDRRYPVLYLLGGFAGDYREWATYGACRILDVMIRGGVVQPMILVTPEGDTSWWFNHAPVDGSDGKRYGDYVWQEVVGFVDANYRTLARRESRAIGGLSAGGQSALMLALTQPQVFSIVGAHSPSIRGADGSLAVFGTREYFKQYDPVWLLQNTDTWKQISIWIDVGRDDTNWGDAIREWHRALDALGVEHEFTDTWQGKHESDYWSARLPDYLMWYSSKLEGE